MDATSATGKAIMYATPLAALERRYYPAGEDAMMRADRPDLFRSSNLANRREMLSEAQMLADLRACLARLEADG